LLAPAYDDGLMSPRARSVVGNGKTLPSPRLVSVNIHNDVSAPHVRYSLMMMQWGQVNECTTWQKILNAIVKGILGLSFQFVDHDITHTPVNRYNKITFYYLKIKFINTIIWAIYDYFDINFVRGFADSILECKDCDAKERIHPECLPIPVPKGDPFYPRVNITSGKPFCLAFTRSMPGQLTLGFREQMNQITSFVDASNVYGSDLCEMRELREFVGGRLNTTKYVY
jgi:peroxidase